MTLATVAFDIFLRGSRSQRHAAAKSLVGSLRRTGFVKLINHGLPLETIEKAQEWENFDVGPQDDAVYPNRWPHDSLPGFQAFTEAFFRECQNLCLDVMSACEIGCDVPEGTFVRRCMPASSELRYNYYPPVSLSRLNEGTTRRGWPHTDFGIITLLFQDTKGGLEYEDRQHPGTFIPLVRERPDEIAINVSDTFQRLTNDFIRAGVHQVSLPQNLSSMPQNSSDHILPERHSTVFFFKAHRECMVGAIPDFVNEQNPAKYDNITALEFHNRMTDILVRNASSPPTAT
ncbi:Clavaminate synthase-like protein [Aspergillus pseudotamarii]|uniref:Clavaminate synthase-like protein n=1 Tax=Aspergillus pseudotamarii TaxID=132259 RepID=A0A5N6T0S2_ASPPS|nr:Clavaminate synthase-like protein [Aspergillus pseudotamarii]KAE8139830.1 Clavaminate synthase-like protein [Aspergillus pseudotamarii]